MTGQTPQKNAPKRAPGGAEQRLSGSLNSRRMREERQRKAETPPFFRRFACSGNTPALPAADKLQQLKRVAVLQGGFGKRPGGHDVPVPLHHDFFRRQPEPEDKVEQRRPSLHTVISPFTVIFMKASCGWPSTKKRPSRGTGVLRIRHDDASLRQYQLRQVPRVWDEPTLSLDRLP